MLNTKLHSTISCKKEDKVIRLNCKSNMHVTYRIRKTNFLISWNNRIKSGEIIMFTTKDSQNILRFFCYLIENLNNKHSYLFIIKS